MSVSISRRGESQSFWRNCQQDGELSQTMVTLTIPVVDGRGARELDRRGVRVCIGEGVLIWREGALGDSVGRQRWKRFVEEHSIVLTALGPVIAP